MPGNQLFTRKERGKNGSGKTKQKGLMGGRLASTQHRAAHPLGREESS